MAGSQRTRYSRVSYEVSGRFRALHAWAGSLVIGISGRRNISPDRAILLFLFSPYLRIGQNGRNGWLEDSFRSFEQRLQSQMGMRGEGNFTISQLVSQRNSELKRGEKGNGDTKAIQHVSYSSSNTRLCSFVKLENTYVWRFIDYKCIGQILGHR